VPHWAFEEKLLTSPHDISRGYKYDFSRDSTVGRGR
jgi:hypothetical protein